MIPDKIYIRHYWMPGELDDEWQLKPVEDEQCEEYIRKDAILAIIQSRLSEIIGDAQPKPALRAELEELIKRIKDEN